MKRIWSLLIMLVCLTGYGAGVEVYIPIGQSPGVSGKLSTIGRITGLIGHTADRIGVIAISDSKTVKWYVLAEETIIYLDRSGSQKTNTVGVFADLKIGALAEVNPRPGRNIAKWVKVAVQ
jgi:hypothetical protein